MTYWSSLSLIVRGERNVGRTGVLVHAPATLFLVDDRLAQLDAFAADIDVAWPFDERPDVAVALAAKGAIGVAITPGASGWATPGTVPESLVGMPSPEYGIADILLGFPVRGYRRCSTVSGRSEHRKRIGFQLLAGRGFGTRGFNCLRAGFGGRFTCCRTLGASLVRIPLILLLTQLAAVVRLSEGSQLVDWCQGIAVPPPPPAVQPRENQSAEQQRSDQGDHRPEQLRIEQGRGAGQDGDPSEPRRLW